MTSLSNKPNIASLLQKQAILLESGQFDPYSYFGISALTTPLYKTKPSKSPYLRRNYESLIGTSSTNENSLTNVSFSNYKRDLKRELSLTNRHKTPLKPLHLKIDLNQFTTKEKKTLEIPTSRSANRLFVPNKAPLQHVRSFINSTNKEPAKEEKGIKKKENLTMNNIKNTLKGLETRYQTTYLSFIKANKKKN